MNIESLRITSPERRKDYDADQIMNVLDGAGGGGTARSEMTATYQTNTGALVIYYTAINPADDSIISLRSTEDVTFSNGLYQRIQDTTGITDFIAIWDEGDIDDYASEWITVDT